MRHRSFAGAAVTMLLFIGASSSTGQPAAAAGPSLAGCPMLPANNPWNTRVDTLPLRSNSAKIIANIQAEGVTHLHPDFSSPTYGYGMPFIVVPQNQPKVKITYDQYPAESDPGPFPIPLNAPVEGGYDRHLIVLQKGTCMLYELWAAHRCGNGWCAGTGAKWNMRRNQVRHINWTSADAAGLAILPGLVRCDELKAGAINHAIRVTMQRTNRGFVLPATHGPSNYQNANFPSFGMRFRLKRGYDISKFTGQAKILATTMKKYGFMLADNGQNWYFQGERAGKCMNDDQLVQLWKIPGTAFEVVNTGKVYPWPYRP